LLRRPSTEELMSDSHEHDASHDDAPHEGPIKTPKQLILAVFFAFVVPITAIILLVNYVATEQKPAAGSNGLTPEAIAERIQPVGAVQIKVAGDTSTMKTGEQVFQAQCSTCHATGALGAPKFGDTAAWGPRISKGFDALLNSALHGKNNMPAQGGGDFSDLEVARAVVYMANHGGAHFAEPQAPAASASQASAEASSAGGADAAAAAQAAAALKAIPTATATASAGGSTTAAAPALFTSTCSACHATGAAGAPKLGDKAAWAPRIAQGIDTLVHNAINGKNAMPPRGGSTASDAQIREVVTYMVNAAK
jgi:cytochrome c5